MLASTPFWMASMGTIFTGVLCYLFYEHSSKRKIIKKECDMQLNMAQKKVEQTTERASEKIREVTERYNRAIKVKDEIYKNFNFPPLKVFKEIGALRADFEFLQTDKTIEYLKAKPHPALVKAKNMKDLRNTSKEYLERYKQILYRYQFILCLFPEIESVINSEDFLNTKKEIEPLYEIFCTKYPTFPIEQSANRKDSIFHLFQVFQESMQVISDRENKCKSLEKKYQKLTLKREKEVTDCKANCEIAIRQNKSICEERIKQNLQEFEEAIQNKDKLYRAITEEDMSNSVSRIKWIVADYETYQYNITENYLRTKAHPAPVKAYEVRQLKYKTKEHVQKYKEMEYIFSSLLDIFPDLENFVDSMESLEELREMNSVKDFEKSFDKIRNYLSKEEYNNLPEEKRSQLALDNYIKRSNKSNWQIGRDYEMFVGHDYMKKGWKVQFFGIEEQIKDMGRDLIAEKDNVIHIVQCKYWSKRKLIHEKHIGQLFASALMYDLTNPSANGLFKKEVIPVFVTSIQLSEMAKKFAKHLKVQVVENLKMGEFPRIKCNINKDENNQTSKIYHLPMDQQYDRTKIQENGEFYASTVKEAMDKGFRRAYKWSGNRTK
jgi:hypothetical protein